MAISLAVAQPATPRAEDGRRVLASLADRSTRRVADRDRALPRRSKTLRLGLLGLGQVGQAVARLAAGTDTPGGAGFRLRIHAAFARHVDRHETEAGLLRLTSNPSDFLRGHYDLVIEALDGLEPARTIVSRLLTRAIPVVTANRTLVAACGLQLAGLAARCGTRFCFEASALAAVPLLPWLARYPFASAVDGFTAIVNGTSTDALATLEADGGTVADALTLADRVRLGTSSAYDGDGQDAADTLILLSALFGWGATDRTALEIGSIDAIEAADLRMARALGGVIRPVAFAERTPLGMEAFVGPACIPTRHPLASVNSGQGGVELHRRSGGPLFFSGPSADAETTAAALVDGALRAFCFRARPSVEQPAHKTIVSAPVTSWLVRAAFPGVAPAASALRDLVSVSGLTVEHVSDIDDCRGRDARWFIAGPTSHAQLDAALTTLAGRHRLSLRAVRRLGAPVRRPQ